MIPGGGFYSLLRQLQPREFLVAGLRQALDKTINTCTGIAGMNI